MTFSQLFSDSFQRANAASWGNGWLDPGSASSLAGNLGEIASVNGSGFNGSGVVYRPASDGNPRDGQISVTFGGTAAEGGSGNGLILHTRLQPSSTAETAYIAGWNICSGGNTALVGTVVSGSFNELASPSLSAVYDPTHNYTLTLSAVGVNPTTLTFTIVDNTAGTTILSYTGTDSTAALQSPTSGVFGIDAFGSTFGLSNITTYTAATALTLGTLTATPTNTAITLSLSGAASGGTGTGYSYQVYRGTDPNFTANSGSLLATVASLPYTDSTAGPGVQYYYGVTVVDSGGNTASSVPAGLGTVTTTFTLYTPAQLQGQPLAIVCLGDSITYGSGVSNAGTVTIPSMPGYLIAKLQRLLGIRAITGSNQGHNGYTTTDFAPTGSTYTACKSAMTSLLSATPGALPVFSIMLGTNDSSQSGANNGSSGSPLPNAQFTINATAIISQLLSDFPGCKVFWHLPSWYSPNTGATGAIKQQIGLSALQGYFPLIEALPAAYAASHPGQVFLGDTYAYPYFAQNYNAELQAEAGSDGTYRLHPLGTAGTNGFIGTQSLGEFHAQAIAGALLGGIANRWTH